MKRFLASSLIMGVSTCGLVGCDETREVEVKTPTGTHKVTIPTEEKKSEEKKPEEKKPDAAKDGAMTPPSTEAPK
jgi:hypothetical protein